MQESFNLKDKTLYNKTKTDDTELLDILMDNIPDSIYFKDKNNRFVKVNKTKAAHSNVEPEEMIGKTDFDFLPEEQAKKSYEDDNKIMQMGQSIIGKIEKITNKDGYERWISVTKIPRYDKEGNIIGTMGISRDITDQKKFEKKLYESEKRYRSIFENSAVGIMTTDEQERIVSWNKYTEKLLGMTQPDLLKKPVKELYPEEEWIKIRKENVRQKGMQHHLETKITKKNGELIDVDISVSVLKNANGQISGSIGIIRDITSRKKTEKKMKIRESAIASSINGIVITDLSGNITYVNDSYLKMWGYESSQEVVYQPIVKFWKSKGKFVNVMDSLLSKGGWTGELIAQKKDRSTFYTHLSATTVKDDNNQPICMMASFIDTTEQKKAEEKIRESEKAKSEFMNIAAHELKSPIIPIKGYLEMLLWDESINKEKKEWLKICLKNVNTLVYLVNDILDVSRLESNSLNLVKEKVNLSKIIKDIVIDMKPAVDKKNLFLKSEIFEDPIEIELDKYRIMQVLRNLISNAVKCTESGGITVKVDRNDKDNKLIVSVTDTGIGISKEDRKRLFKKFSQLDSGETRKVEGTGLGLYISKGIVEKHDGNIWVESNGIGKGSSFKFSIPM